MNNFSYDFVKETTYLSDFIMYDQLRVCYSCKLCYVKFTEFVNKIFKTCMKRFVQQASTLASMNVIII